MAGSAVGRRPPAVAAQAPTVAASIAKPRPTPSPVHTVRVTLTRSGEQSRDVQKLHRVHSLLVGHSGQDRFIIRLTGGASKAVELAFPNDTTHYSSELKQKLVALVGAGAVRVEAAR